jgi:hypothetical protein
MFGPARWQPVDSRLELWQLAAGSAGNWQPAGWRLAVSLVVQTPPVGVLEVGGPPRRSASAVNRQNASKGPSKKKVTRCSGSK